MRPARGEEAGGGDRGPTLGPQLATEGAAAAAAAAAAAGHGGTATDAFRRRAAWPARLVWVGGGLGVVGWRRLVWWVGAGNGFQGSTVAAGRRTCCGPRCLCCCGGGSAPAVAERLRSEEKVACGCTGGEA